jgi:RNA polymerase sigma-70 factor, ECF subfamily
MPAKASRLMRQVLVDCARERLASEREGGCRITFEHLDALAAKGDAELLALDDALNELSAIDERQRKIVEIKIAEIKLFGGCRLPRYRECWGISRATVDRDWLPSGSDCIGRRAGQRRHDH